MPIFCRVYVMKTMIARDNKNKEKQVAFNSFLFDCRNSEHNTTGTGVSPAMLIFRHEVRTRFNTLL